MNSYVINMLSNFKDSPFLALITVISICVTVVIILLLFRKRVDNVSFGKLNIKTFPGERRDRIKEVYMIDKIRKVEREINILLLDVLRERKTEIFNEYFKKIEETILEIYERELIKRLKEIRRFNEKEGVRNTQAYLYYEKIISDITKENLQKIFNYTRNFDLWCMSVEKFEAMKKKQSEKYQKKSIEIFSDRFNHEIILFSQDEHEERCIQKASIMLDRHINELQNELRAMEIEIFNKIKVKLDYLREEVKHELGYIYKVKIEDYKIIGGDI